MKKQLLVLIAFVCALLVLPIAAQAQTPTPSKGQSMLAWTMDERKLAVGNTNGLIYILNADGQILKKLSGAFASVGPVSWSPDGNLLASGGRGNFVLIWDIERGVLLHKLYPSTEGEPDPLYYGAFNLAWSSNGKHILATSFDAFQFWDTATWLPNGGGRSGSLFDAEWSPDGAVLALANFALQLYNGETLQMDDPAIDSINTIKSEGYRPSTLSWSRDSRYLAVISVSYSKASVWEVSTRTRVGEFSIADGVFMDVVFISGNRVAVITETGKLYLLNLNGDLLATYETGVEGVRRFAWNERLAFFTIIGENTIVDVGGVSGLPTVALSAVLGSAN
jgi:WD40 repeat protein